VGGSSEIRSDFRLLAATHRNLVLAVKEGRFREDLFFRIAVLELELPPLRDREEDVLLLAQEFLKEFRGKHDRHRRQLSPEACDLLLRYSWPGNVRELRNVIQRAVVMSSGELLHPQHFPDRLRRAARPARRDGESDVSEVTGALRAPLPPGSSSNGDVPTLDLEDLERRAIAQAIRQTRGNISEVVRLLGIGRTTLYRKLKKYQMR
jgi:DNA-binding NtrC family response regulator